MIVFRCVVWTGDKRVFFYNPSTKASLWDCPPELKNRPEVDELTKEPPNEKKQVQNNKRNIEPEENNKDKENVLETPEKKAK